MSLFANRELWLAVRQRAVPYLRTFPSVNVWFPACGAGEAVYACAIVLREEGLFGRATLYATEQSDQLLQQARAGLYSPEPDAARAYADAGGRASLDEYHSSGVMRPLLRERITFAQHSLASDASFNEFQLVFCPNELALARHPLRERAVQLIHQSLCRFGLLAFDRGKSSQPSLHRSFYERFADGLLRKMA